MNTEYIGISPTAGGGGLGRLRSSPPSPSQSPQVQVFNDNLRVALESRMEKYDVYCVEYIRIYLTLMYVFFQQPFQLAQRRGVAFVLLCCS